MTARQYLFNVGGGSGSVTDRLMFGQGMDGAVTISSSQTITGDKFYSDLTIDIGVIFKVGQVSVRSPRKIFCSGTLTINGTLRGGHDPGSATPNGFPTGDTAGTGSGGSLGGSANGGIAGTGGAGAGSAGAAGGNSGVANPAGIGGAGGAGSGGAGGAGGAGGQAGASKPIDYFTDDFWRFNAYTGGGAGGGAGGNGGGGGGNGGNGAQGGAGAGIVWICARNIIISSTGQIDCDGADGSTGGNGASGNAGGGGGGAGGAGGFIMLGFESLTNNGVIRAAGGAGGAGGSGVGTGVAGSPGSAGSAGRIYKYNFSTGLYE